MDYLLPVHYGMDSATIQQVKIYNSLRQRLSLKYPHLLSGPAPIPQQGPVTASQVRKLLLKERTQVEDVSKLSSPSPPPSEETKLNIKTFLEEHTGVGIYSMEDVVAQLNDPGHNPMPGLYDDEEISLKMYQNFKRFDTVEDHSDHLFSAHSSATKQPPIDWANKIHEDWSILKERLPETIFVRVYEDRMDLLRAVIIGPKGTPYHDGLFFFDMYYPSNYPDSPPRVCSLSFFLGVNPNLNESCHEIPLIRMYTTAILENLWVPGISNMLQYLVSIQDLFSNRDPLLNVLSTMGDTPAGELPCLLYNENILIESLKTMVCTMTKPPKHFDVFVAGHFRKRAHEILMACNSYKEGLQVGCLVSSSMYTCSTKFQKDSASCIKLLVKAFFKIGAMEVESYLHQIETKTPSPPAYAPTLVGDKDVAVLRKRKGVFDEGLEKKKMKLQDMNHLYPGSVTSPSAITVAQLLVGEGYEVEKGKRFYAPLCDLPPWKSEAGDLISRSDSEVTKFLERRQSSLFLMEDVLMDKNECHPMKWLENEEDVLKRYKNFSKFDAVVDHSDHFFSAESSAVNQAPKEWVDKIHEEWRSLAENLPETIFVRVYEDRMDLLRAVIIGPPGTPYQNGLFFFDVCFPVNYPDSPPLLNYRSGGLGINPNLHRCGKVQLSLPKTTGVGQETMWDVGTSTVLQLLVSIQDKILNAEPLFNDFAHAMARCCVDLEESSVLYNESIWIKSQKTMVYTMEKPPKDFEAFVIGHFRKHASDILTACNKETCSVQLKKASISCFKQLVDAFSKIGAKENQEASPL